MVDPWGLEPHTSNVPTYHRHKREQLRPDRIVGGSCATRRQRSGPDGQAPASQRVCGAVLPRACPPARLGRVRQLVEAFGAFSAAGIDHQVTRDGKQPGLELRLAVVLMTPGKNPQPGLLKKISGGLPAARQIEQVAEEAVLVKSNQALEQLGITASQAARQRSGLRLHREGEKVNRAVHSTFLYEGPRRKDAGTKRSCHIVTDRFDLRSSQGSTPA